MGKLKEIIIGNLTIHKTFELAMSSIEEEILKHFIPIDEVKILIAREITIATSEGQPTSRLTSLYNKLPIDKSNKEEVTNEL